MTDEQKSLSWWQTAPGLLTAIASLLAALGGLIVAIYPQQVKEASDPRPSFEDRASKTSFDEIQEVPATELSKLRSESGDMIAMDTDHGVADVVYNGSTWRLKEITVYVRLIDADSYAIVFDKYVSLPLSAGSSGEPFKTSKFEREGVFPVFPQGTTRKVKNLGIVSAHGVRTVARE